MLNAINTFKVDEAGAVTVDWIVLTAALVGLGIAVMATVSSGIQTRSTNISAGLADTTVQKGFATLPAPVVPVED